MSLTMEGKMNWDDVRIFVSVSKEKSFSHAAKKHQTTQATISRRIHNFEIQLGHKLFNRGQEGCALTSHGKNLLEYAMEMQSWADAFEEKVKSINNENRSIVITCGNMIARHLSAHLSDLYSSIEGSNIEIRATPENLSLEKHEADIALRNTRPTSGQLKIRKLAVNHFLDFYVYGNKKFYSEYQIKDVNEFDGFPWASYTSNMAHLSSAKWLKNCVLERSVKYRLSCSSLLVETLHNSEALAILPRFIGDPSQHLTKLYGPIQELKSDLWLIRRNDQYDKQIRKISNNIESIFRSC